MNYTFSDLKTKEVIHVGDGERLGFVSDVEIDAVTGRVLSISVPGAYRILGIWGKEPDQRIPWENIKKIGDDLIIISNKRDERDVRSNAVPL
ncbi:MAG: YlmC/YmxH family sporulation protein [Clostridia bacterium]|nr:YlmC/YmxH family sporulation protein [Clostridia bacterium]